MGSLERVVGVVWCHVHGVIHDASIDPYQTGEPECERAEHRPVYFRKHKGDS